MKPLCLFFVILALGPPAGALAAPEPSSPRQSASPVSETSGPKPPYNVLIIVADDLGTDHVGAYTHTATPTPNIDGIAARGLRFTNAWANPLCSPTRAAIHTGRYGFRTGVQSIVRAGSPANSLLLAETTLPELFDGPLPTAYSTALVGKWHLDNQTSGPAWGPIAHGWDYFAGSVAGSITSYCSWPRSVASVTQPTPTSQWTGDYATTRTVDDALSWIASSSSPWMCFVSFNAPHYPLHAPPSNLHTRTLPPSPTCENLGPALAPFMSDFYGAMVEALDTEVGRLLYALEDSGELAWTNVFFLGDNGAPTCVVGPPYSPYQGKGTVYEGSVRVPFLVSGPSVAQPGRDVKAMVDVVDLFRTIAELCSVQDNIPAGVTIDSKSLIPFLVNKNPQWSRPFLLTEVGPFFDGCANGRPPAAHRGAVAIRDMEGNKLLRWRNWDNPAVIVERLYDLRSDPFEMTPLPLQGTVYSGLLAGLQSFGCGSLCQ
jgi:arylsulfatase A-like enzyme